MESEHWLRKTLMSTLGAPTHSHACVHTYTLVNMYTHTHTHWRGTHKNRTPWEKFWKETYTSAPFLYTDLPSRFVPDSSENSMKILALCQSIATSLEGHDFNIRIAQTLKAPTGLLSHSVEPRLLAVSSWPLCPVRVSFAAIFCVLEDWIPYVLPYHKFPEAVMIHT